MFYMVAQNVQCIEMWLRWYGGWYKGDTGVIWGATHRRWYASCTPAVILPSDTQWSYPQIYSRTGCGDLYFCTDMMTCCSQVIFIVEKYNFSSRNTDILFLGKALHIKCFLQWQAHRRQLKLKCVKKQVQGLSICCIKCDNTRRRVLALKIIFETTAVCRLCYLLHRLFVAMTREPTSP